MPAANNQRVVLLIIGPTGIGKSGLAIKLAKRINGEIISADSRYLYRGMDIGTAKPTATQLTTVPHHLIDVADPSDTWSLARFLQTTLEHIGEIHKRNRIPVITGGTGQYVRALTEGWQVPDFDADQTLRNVLTEWGQAIGGQELHQKLKVVDAAAAQFIEASNMRRTIRALEVMYATGSRFSELRQKAGPAHAYWIIGLRMEREALYKLVDERIEQMVAMGLELEVRRLLELGYGADLPAMSAIGYREMIRYINGEIDLETAKGLMRKNTRNLVRRQANWFKSNDPEIHWYDVNENTYDLVLTDLTVARIPE